MLLNNLVILTTFFLVSNCQNIIYKFVIDCEFLHIINFPNKELFNFTRKLINLDP